MIDRKTLIEKLQNFESTDKVRLVREFQEAYGLGRHEKVSDTMRHVILEEDPSANVLHDEQSESAQVVRENAWKLDLLDAAVQVGRME